MRLDHLRLRTFRAHTETDVETAPIMNLFVGRNGAGKTNLLEAVSVLCMGKSFLASSDRHVVQREAPFYEVEGRFSGRQRSELTLRVAYAPGEGKRAFINGSPLERLADLVGQVPVVILSPEDYELTAGGPSERRRFLDATLSQAYPVYLDDSLKYRRALKQRNALLKQVRKGGSLPNGTMDAWDEEIATLGTRLVQRRRRFLKGFKERLTEVYRLLGEPGRKPSLTYEPSVAPEADDEEDEGEGVTVEAYRRELRRQARKERDRGRTLIGPHLDEIVFRLGDFELRPYASQGQHRTFGLAVRLASALFFRDHFEEPPLLLLDDVFGTLDPRRAGVVLDLLSSGNAGQSLLTAARVEPFQSALSFDADAHRVFEVEAGHVEAAEALSLP